MIEYEDEVQRVLIGDMVPWELLGGRRRIWRQVCGVINKPYGAIELHAQDEGETITLYFPRGDTRTLIRYEQVSAERVE
jgi:hypothetical protein